MSFSSLTSAAKSMQVKIGLCVVFMISIGSCMQAQAQIKSTDVPKTIDEANPVYAAVEQSAQFPGGVQAFAAYLGKSIQYPDEARTNKVQGKVFATFVVEKDGSLSDVKILRGIGSGCDEEAVRVLKMSPQWEPGKQNNLPVRQQYTVPINFTLPDK